MEGVKTNEPPIHILYKGVTIRCVNRPLPWFEINLAGRSLPHMETLKACGEICGASSLAEVKVCRNVWLAKLIITWYLYRGYHPHNGQLIRKEVKLNAQTD